MLVWIGEIIAVIVALVNIVERPGDGAEKRSEVVGLVLEKLSEHVSIPKWAESLFLRKSFIGWLVDVIVWAANKAGFFGDGGTQETA